MTLLHKQDMQGRLDEILNDFKGYKINVPSKFEAYDLKFAQAKERLTHLIEAYVAAELEELLPEIEIGNYGFWVRTRIKDKLKQLNSKEIK